MSIGRIGRDFVVNSTTSNGQFKPAVAALADGRFVFAWHSAELGDGSGTCIRARLYNADGSVAVDQLAGNSTTAGDQADPYISALPDGRFVIAWHSLDSGDGSGTCIRARIYNADGSAAGSDFIVNTSTTSDQEHAEITALADGRFVIAWHSLDSADGSGTCIRARIYNADGSPAGNDVMVNSTAAGSQNEPAVTGLPDGRFVLAWSSQDAGDGSGSCIRARLFDADGSSDGNDFIVNSTKMNSQHLPAAMAFASGRFVVAWSSGDPGDGSGSCIRARVFNAGGSAVGNDFIVNSTASSNQGHPAIAALADGRFVVAWLSDDTGDGSGSCIRGRLFDADGVAVGNDFIVNSTGANAQEYPKVAALADGRFVVTWQSSDTGDGSDGCVRAGIFDPTIFVGTVGEDDWRGGSFADRISGGVSDDRLSGLEGNDLINGGRGDDTLDGGIGDDRLLGGDDADRLDGGAGSDLMAGGTGNDIFFVDNAADAVVELAGQGADVVFASTTYALAAGLHVETFAATPQAGAVAIRLTGNEIAQRINGNDGSNTLYGMAGNDVLIGYGGNDNLEGGPGADTLKGVAGVDKFVFRQSTVATAGADHISDFDADDFIYFDHPSVTGPLSPLAFVAGANALDANDRFIYYAPYDALYFDQDGNGAAAKVLIAVFDNGYAPTAADIFLF